MKNMAQITIKVVVNVSFEESASVTEVDLPSQFCFCFDSLRSRLSSFSLIMLQLSVTSSSCGTHWKSFTLAQYCAEKNTLSGALLNPVLRRMILPSVREWTFSISCQ